MANTLWDGVETVLDRQPRNREENKSSSFSNTYFRDLSHSSLLEAHEVEGDLALDTMHSQIEDAPREPVVPRAYPQRGRAPSSARDRGRTTHDQVPGPGHIAPVIPLPGTPVTDPGGFLPAGHAETAGSAPADPFAIARAAAAVSPDRSETAATALMQLPSTSKLTDHPQAQRGAGLQSPIRANLPLLKLNEKPVPAAPRRNVRCYSHGHLGTRVCINCETPLCPDCDYLLINDRPWCMHCGRPYKPGLLSSLLLALKVIFKASLFVGAVAATIFLAPAPLAVRAVIAVGVGLVLAWFLFLNDDVDFEVKVVKGK